MPHRRRLSQPASPHIVHGCERLEERRLLAAVPVPGDPIVLDFEGAVLDAGRADLGDRGDFYDAVPRPTKDLVDDGAVFRNQLSGTAVGPTLVPDAMRGGTVMRMDIGPTTDGRERNEFFVEEAADSANRNGFITRGERVRWGEERFFGFSFRVPEDFVTNLSSSSDALITQWWQKTRNGGDAGSIGNPPMAVVLRSREFDVLNLALDLNFNTQANPENGINVELASTEVTRGVWYDVMIHSRLST
ncbi:MAG: heparin lyase I family protein, partial [Planctomycetota bacterium]